MKIVEKRNRRKIKSALKKIVKEILFHEVELHNAIITREITSAFHTDPKNHGMVKEEISVPYSINTRNLFYSF